MIKIFKAGIELKHTRMLFPAGDLGIKLDMENYKFFHTSNNPNHQTIIAKLQDSNDVIELLMVTDALRRVSNIPINLFLPYFNYAQQDRVCVKGEAFSAKVFANLINSQNYNKVTICDPHSDVSSSIINNVEVIAQLQIVDKFRDLNNRIVKGAIFVAPDAGSNKKTSELAKYFGHTSFIRADKLRNLHTGQIIETIVYTDDLKHSDVIICDDICVAGGTFIGLAKELKMKNCGKVILFCTHGIFSKGTKILFDGFIDEIYSTNSYHDVLPAGVDNVNFLNLEQTFLENEITEPKMTGGINVAL